MRYLLTALTVLFISGCSSFSNKSCGISDCSRPLSTHQSLVIWWGNGMRDSLNKDEDTTTYVLVSR
ncbi:HrpT family type III secretion system protein [Marinomonas balearica]|uniref:HrpT family type III secretion system protein n=1 Tax=Marinomonas balearica TaxID=491947 RepID=UPI003C79BF39